MIIITTKIRYQSLADRDFVLSEMEKVGDATRNEPGVIDYRSAINPYDPLLMHGMEMFVSEEAIIAHHQSEHMRNVIAKIGHIKTEISAKAYKGDFEKFDLTELVMKDTFAPETGEAGIKVSWD